MFDPQRTVNLIKGALLDPEPTWRSYLPEAGNWQKTAVLLTGPLIVASALIAYVLGMLGGGPFGIRPTLTSTVLSMVSGVGLIIGTVSAPRSRILTSTSRPASPRLASGLSRSQGAGHIGGRSRGSLAEPGNGGVVIPFQTSRLGRRASRRPGSPR